MFRNKDSFNEPTSRRTVAIGLTVSMSAFLTCGCTGETAAKKTLFEDDHVAAAHWPDGLSDVSIQLRRRLGGEKIDTATLSEIRDLVGWTAEVAADTPLSESDWVPLYEATESLSSRLRAAGDQLSTDDREQIESLCRMVDQAVTKIPVREKSTNTPPESDI